MKIVLTTLETDIIVDAFILNSELKSPTVHLIREIYDGENAYDSFIADLDRALIEKYDYIIVEPCKVSDETSRWIMVGNCLHKTAVLTGLVSIASGSWFFRDDYQNPFFNIWYFNILGCIWPKNITLSSSFGFVSLFCTSLYTISWNTDPCVHYQIERNPKKLPKFPNLNEFTSPVVLTHKSNKKTKYVHRVVTSLAVGICAYRIYEAVK